MTDAEYDWAAMTDVQRDWLIAITVMGWTQDEELIWHDDIASIPELPWFSTHAPSAWLVLEKMISFGHHIMLNHDGYSWSCTIGESEMDHKDVPVAICLAALWACGVDIDDGCPDG